MRKQIAILASCDTKFSEVKFLKDFIDNAGYQPVVIDISIGSGEIPRCDVSRDEFFNILGFTWDEVKQYSKGHLMELITSASAIMIPKLYREGLFHGILSLGGVQNTMVAVNGMKKLPIGIPKVIASTVASGNRTFDSIVGTKDITVMPSIADIAGLNCITRNILSNAASCVIGMLDHAGTPVSKSDAIVVGTTLMGVTNDGVCSAISYLQEQGIEVVGFHSTGVGGRAMEELVESRLINAVMDLTIHEITSEYFGGGFSYGAFSRLRMLCESGVPLLISLGGLDFVDYAISDFPKNLDDRKYIKHNEHLAHIKITKEEAVEVAKITADRLNGSTGPVTVLIPVQGFRKDTKPGEILYDREVDDAIIETLKNEVTSSNVKFIQVDANLNDAEFGIIAAKKMIEIIENFNGDTVSVGHNKVKGVV